MVFFGFIAEQKGLAAVGGFPGSQRKSGECLRHIIQEPAFQRTERVEKKPCISQGFFRLFIVLGMRIEAACLPHDKSHGRQQGPRPDKQGVIRF